MLNKIIKNNAGVTLLELTVAVAIFSTVVLSATQIFKMVLDGQRSAISAQSTQEGMRYALEVMSKEIRMAQKTKTGLGPPECGIPKGTVYRTIAGNNLIFKNIHDQCVEYSLENDAKGILRLKIERDGVSAYITPDEIEVSGLEFDVIDNVGINQSNVIIKMTVYAVGKGLNKSKIKIQSAISSRYYE